MSVVLAIALLRFVAASLYLVVSAVLARRAWRDGPPGPLWAFSAWWAGIGLVMLLTVPTVLGVRFELWGLLQWFVVVYALYLVLLTAIAGLIYYLLYLYTGRHGVVYISWAYLVLMSGYMFYTLETAGATIDHAAAGVVFTTGAPPWESRIFMALLAIPPLLAAVAYSLLWFRVDDREVRRRIALVSGAFLLWFSFIIVSRVAGLVSGGPGDLTWGAVADQLVGAVAALLVAAAYRHELRLGHRPKAALKPPVQGTS